MNQYRPKGFSAFPPVVKNLIIINILIFAASYVLEKVNIIDLDFFGALYYWKSPLFHIWQPITNIFLHANVTHLFSNMFSLWMFGCIIENMIGAKRFLLFYFVCGLGGSLCYSIAFHFEHLSSIHWFNQLSQMDKNEVMNMIITTGRGPAPAIPMFYSALGASGATMGVLFAFGYLFPNEEFFFWGLFPIKAKVFVAILGVIELMAGIRYNPMDNVAHFAHVGGMLFSYLLLHYWEVKSKTNRYR